MYPSSSRSCSKIIMAGACPKCATSVRRVRLLSRSFGFDCSTTNIAKDKESHDWQDYPIEVQQPVQGGLQSRMAPDTLSGEESSEVVFYIWTDSRTVKEVVENLCHLHMVSRDIEDGACDAVCLDTIVR